jgi:hypothetical protein
VATAAPKRLFVVREAIAKPHPVYWEKRGDMAIAVYRSPL